MYDEEKGEQTTNCFYCGRYAYQTGGLDEHHVVRRSVDSEYLRTGRGRTVRLCRPCHERATRDREFEERVRSILNLRESVGEDGGGMPDDFE